jgi:hypothetical protein
MSEMVERVAKAARKKSFELRNRASVVTPSGAWDEVARAAIAAMRVPTDGMIDAASQAIHIEAASPMSGTAGDRTRETGFKNRCVIWFDGAKGGSNRPPARPPYRSGVPSGA